MTETEPQERETSTRKIVTIVLIVLAALCLLMVLLCAGGGFFFYSKAKDSVILNPDEVRIATQQIVTVDVPEELTPIVAVDMMGLKMTMYQSTDSQSAFALMQFGGMMAQAAQNPEQMRQQMKQSMQQQGHSPQPLRDTESETISLNVRGQHAAFEFVKGTMWNDKTGWEVSGMFDTANGPAMLWLAVPDDAWPKSRIVTFIESIR